MERQEVSFLCNNLSHLSSILTQFLTSWPSKIRPLHFLERQQEEMALTVMLFQPHLLFWHQLISKSF